jgi:hypothetical protein
MRWLLLVCVLLAPCLLSAQDADAQAREIVDQPAYRGYRVVPDEAGHWDESRQSTDGYADDHREDRRGAIPRRERQVREADPGHSSAELPAWLESVIKVLGWIFLVVFVGALVFGIGFAIYKLIKDRSRKSESAIKSRKTKAEAKAAEADEVEDIEPEEQAHVPPVFANALAAARRELEEALAAGDYARAALVRYRIFWLEAGWTGCVDSDDVTTWRDALRKVRQSGARTSLRRLLRLVEQVRYGSHVPNEHEFKTWQDDIEQVNARGVLQ